AVGGVVAWKMNCPRQTAPASVAATVEQAADAAKDISQRDARGEHVGGLPQRHFFQAQVNEAGEDGADEAAVINEAAVLNHENFRKRLAGKFVLPIRRHINNARAD